MLSIFPSLLAFEGFSPLILRLTLGAIFLFWAYKRLSPRIKSKNFKDTKQVAAGVIEALTGLSLVLGIFTQIGALVSAIVLGWQLIQKMQKKSFLTDGVNYYLILFVISISLLITGAGFIAFDLPL